MASNRLWAPLEIEIMFRCRDLGKTIQETGDILGRSKASVQLKLCEERNLNRLHTGNSMMAVSLDELYGNNRYTDIGV